MPDHKAFLRVCRHATCRLKSALESRNLGYLLPSDAIVMHAHELLHVAVGQARAMFDAGYRPPMPGQTFPVLGRNGIATIRAQLVNLRDGGFISAYDDEIATRIATLLCGGDVEEGAPADEVTLMALACCAVLLVPGVWGQVGVMLAAGGAGWWLFGRGRAATPETPNDAPDALLLPLRRRTGAALLVVFAALLVLLPLAVRLWPGSLLAMVDAFYRVGALVFGGGHVVLPLLQAEVVGPGWVSADAFLAGYGATQAVPGPLFTFAAFLGASMQVWPGGWLGAVVCLVAIFVPSFLLVAGALPFWEPLRRSPHAQAALAGVNAAVVGLLLAALYNPVWTSAIRGGADFGLALVAFVVLVFWRAPPWAVVLACGVGGAVLAAWL